MYRQIERQISINIDIIMENGLYSSVQKIGKLLLLKRIQEIYKLREHYLISADISIFYRKSAIFVISGNTDVDCILMHNIYIFYFVLVFKGYFNKYRCNFDYSTPC